MELYDALRGDHSPVSRVDLLASDLKTILRTVDNVTGGTVVSDRTLDTFDSADVTALNADGLLSPTGANAALVEDRPARVYRGAILDGAPTYEPLMTGTVGQIGDESIALGEISFTMSSRLEIAKRNFTAPTTYPVGMRGRDALRDMGEQGQLGTSDWLYDFDDGGYLIRVPRTYETKDEILGSMIKWAFDMGTDLYPNPLGSLVQRPFVDLAEVAPSWDFGARQLLRFPRQRTAQRPVNRQIVYYTPDDGKKVPAQVVIVNPHHPLYWRPDFDLPAEPYDSPDVHDYLTAMAIARRLLQARSAVQETRTAEAVPSPFARAGRVATFSASGVEGGFLLDNAAIPLAMGAMRTTIRRMIALV